MAKQQRSSTKKTFWVYFTVAFLLASLIYWMTLSGPSADNAQPTATADAGACSVNIVLAIDTSQSMKTKVGNDTRLAAAVASAEALLTHFTQVNAKLPSGATKTKIGLKSFPNNSQQVALTDDFAQVKTKLGQLKAEAGTPQTERFVIVGGASDGNTLSAGLKGAQTVLKAGGQTTRETSYIVVISPAKNSERDEKDTRLAVNTATDIKASGVTIESFGFEGDGLYKNVSSGATRAHLVKSTTDLTAAMNAFSEDTCPRQDVPQTAACSSSLDLAYLLDDTASFGDDNTVVGMMKSTVQSMQGKLLTGKDRAAVLATSPRGNGGYVRQAFDADLAKATTAAQNVAFRDTGNVNTGILQASNYIRQNRRVEAGKLVPAAVIIVTDEKTSLNNEVKARATQDFTRYGIRYYVVKVGPANATQFTNLTQFAQAAGGTSFEILDSNNADQRQQKVQQAVTDISNALASNVANCVDVELSVDRNNVKEGEQVTATYLVTNTSRTPASQVKITQPLPTGLKADAPLTLNFEGEVQPGATATKSATLTAE